MTVVELPAVPRVLIAEADPWSRDLLKQVLLNVRLTPGQDWKGNALLSEAIGQVEAELGVNITPFLRSRCW